jgi:membrane-bound lytic murein transglycosylase F
MPGASRCRVAALGTLLLWPTTGTADLPEVQARGVLRVLAVLEEKGKAITETRADSAGFDYEVLDGFARLRRLRLELVSVPGWDRLIPELNEGRGDLIAGSFTVTDARKRVIDFTAEVLPTRSVVVTRRPHRVVRTVEELRRERVTVYRGTSMVDLLNQLGVPAANLDYVPPGTPLTDGLRSGRSTCLVHEIQTAIAEQRADPDLQLGLFVGPPMSYAYGVRKSDPRLRQALDDYLASMRRSPTWSRLVVKYYGQTALDILQKARGE